MVVTGKFQGKFMYYENVNGKEKKISKEFTDPKKFNDFTKKYPMPSLWGIFGLIEPVKKPLVKKTVKKPLKSPTKKK